MAAVVLLLAFAAGCTSGGVPDDEVLQQQMSAKGWLRDTRVMDRATVQPFAGPAQSGDEMVVRAAAAWGVNPRKLRKVVLVGSGVDPARLDMLAAASQSSGVLVRQLVSSMAYTSKAAASHDLSFAHHLAMVATLAMFDPEPHRVREHFQGAIDGLASAHLPSADPTLDLPGRILVLDRWRRSHEAGSVRDGCLDGVISDPDHRRAVSLLLQDYYMVVYCDLVGRFSCSTGQAWQDVGFYPLPDGIEKEETWRVMEVSRQVLMWSDR